MTRVEGLKTNISFINTDEIEKNIEKLSSKTKEIRRKRQMKKSLIGATFLVTTAIVIKKVTKKKEHPLKVTFTNADELKDLTNGVLDSSKTLEKSIKAFNNYKPTFEITKETTF